MRADGTLRRVLSARTLRAVDQTLKRQCATYSKLDGTSAAGATLSAPRVLYRQRHADCQLSAMDDANHSILHSGKCHCPPKRLVHCDTSVLLPGKEQFSPGQFPLGNFPYPVRLGLELGVGLLRLG